MSELETIQRHKGLKEQLDRIEGKVDKTNDRVNKLENWRWFITGGLAILAIMIVPILLIIIEKNI